MKYNININQKAIVDNGLDLDLIDCAIMDYIKDFVSSGKIIKKVIDGEDYFWIQYEHLLSEMPLLGIVSKRSISVRIDKLIKEKILEKKIVKGNSTYFKFGDNYLALISSTPCIQNDITDVLEMTSINNTIIDYNNITPTPLEGEEIKANKKEREITDLESVSTDDLIEWRNTLPRKYNFSSFRGKRGQPGYENVNRTWIVRRKQYTKDEFNKAMELYCADIDKRNPNTDYARHRFSLYEWIKQSNGLIKFSSL